MKAFKIFLGLAFIAIAVLLILEALGMAVSITSVIGDVSFWQVAGGIFLVSGIIKLLTSGNFYEVFVPLGFLFMIFERNIAYIVGMESQDIINNWLVFGCSLLLSAGFMFIFPGSKKKKRNAKKGAQRSGFCFHIKDNEFGSAVTYIDCEDFGNTIMAHSVKNKFGSLEVRFDNAESYKGGAALHVDNHFGAIEICVPKSWRIIDHIDVHLGAIDLDNDGEDQDGPTLTIEGDISLGAIDIERI